jgi:hypothetical protein
MTKFIAAAALPLLLSGCALAPYQPGILYADVTLPVDVRDNTVGCAKRGTATTKNYLGLVSTGDAGIEQAKAAAGITKVGSVDAKYKNILMFYNETTTTVCGE